MRVQLSSAAAPQPASLHACAPSLRTCVRPCRRLQRERKNATGREIWKGGQRSPQGTEKGGWSAKERDIGYGDQLSPQGPERDLSCSPFSLPRISHGYFSSSQHVHACAASSPGPIPRRPPPTGSKVLPVEEGSGARRRPWRRTFAIAKGQGRRRPGYKGLGTR